MSPATAPGATSARQSWRNLAHPTQPDPHGVLHVAGCPGLDGIADCNHRCESAPTWDLP